ncbi:MAG: NAD(P)/FAD-dependent oxidoreductase [Bacilli bacterium]|nr:NAD(P)/FAD-dependent oxidoreductase [Bacilli bacterium]
MFDCIIIGGGPAGISASLYLKRSNKNVLVLYKDESQLLKAHKIDNYYGFEEGISGKDLYDAGIKQAKNLGIDLRLEEVLDIQYGMDNYLVKSDKNIYETKYIILATGNKKLRPNIKGIIDYEGKGVSYCAICDGFFYKKKRIAVIGDSLYAKEEANVLKNVSEDIIILSNGKKIKNDDFKVIDKEIEALIGDEVLRQVVFKDGSTIDIDACFIAIGSAGGANFAKQLGIMMENELIITNDNMETNINGIYACGDLVKGIKQVNKAVYEGAIAALDIINKINERK